MSELASTQSNGDGEPGPPAPPTALTFTVLGAEPIEYAAAPGVRLHLHVTEPEGRDVYTIALSTQVHIEPARRVYDDETRARLVELFGAPERWGATTHPFMWAKVECLVPQFTGSTAFTMDIPCTYDLEVASAKFFDSLTDGDVPLGLHFNGTVMYRGDDDRLQVVLVPWSCSAKWRLPIDVWKRTIAAHYPGGGWVRLAHDTLEALAACKAERGMHTFDATVASLLQERS